MSEALKRMVLPEFGELKDLLADKDAELAHKDAELAHKDALAAPSFHPQAPETYALFSVWIVLSHCLKRTGQSDFQAVAAALLTKMFSYPR